MEALAALSLAGNVVQFVQFAYGLIHSTSRIYASASGASAQTEHLDYVHNQLMVQYAKMSTDEHLTTVGRFAPLVDMVTRSQQVGQQLLDMINELKLKNVKSGKWWKSLGKALREVRKLDEIQELQRRIDDLQRAMVLYLCTTSGETIETIAQDAATLRMDNLAMHNERSQQLGKLSEAVRDVRLDIQDLKSRAWGGEMIMEQSDITWITSRIHNLSLTTHNFKKENAVLRSLDYEMRTNRREAIPTAHEETFQWVFTRQSTDQTGVSFVEWLEHGDSPFWITGRPGSGKSTLMRFISTHSDTLRALERVAAPCKAFIVEHYFWSAGTVMQRSQEGLYRSLLLQILARVPAMIHALPGLEGKSPEELARERWGLDQLHAALDALANDDSISAMFGIFIDGIDEYDGDHVDICKTLLRLSGSKKVKLCFSSRPWNVFQDHFGQDRTAMLAVHDLTFKDIQAYVAARLKDHYRWKAVATKSCEAESLITEISKKAHGVFLWVFLMTKLIREGLTNDDSITDLRRRLEVIPSDLESFFQHILDRVEPFYQDKMAGTLAMALVATRPLEAELYAFGEDEFDDSEYAIKQPVKVIDPHDKQVRIQTFSRRLNGRCKGLLEIDQYGEVQFLHRTVRDFLRTKHMEDFLRSKNRTRLEPHLSVFKAYISSMKQSRFTDGIKRHGPGMFLGVFVSKLKAALCYVGDAYAQADQIESLVDEMESATMAIFASDQAEASPRVKPQSPRLLFRECILVYGPIHYLSRKLASSPKYFIDFDEPPLNNFLHHTVEAPAWDHEAQSRSEQLTIVKKLLESGANPNQLFPDKTPEGLTTPWRRYISLVVEPQDNSVFAGGIIEKLLSSGAAPNAMTHAPCAVTLGYESVQIQAWLNLFFSVFTRKFADSDSDSQHLEALICTMEKGADFSSMTLPTFHSKSTASATVTPWNRLKELIRKGNDFTELQSQALAKLAQFSGPDLLPWGKLMPLIRRKFSAENIQVIEEALAKQTRVQHGLVRSKRRKRIRGAEDRDMETRKARRSKGE